jgi:sulfate adenylyltransferase subunit 1
MDSLSFVIVGHVDHGKSTLIGRLLYDTNALPPDKIAEIEKVSDNQGKRTEFAYLLDHLQEERQQGITIDTTQIFFSTKKRRYVIIDAPGHIEFVKNMITGASQAEAAVLIVDVAEGVKEQTKRHSYLLSLLGLDQVIVVMNKMDLVDFSQARFEAVKSDIATWLSSIRIEPIAYVPVSAIEGYAITSLSDKMPWYEGPTFLESMDQLRNKLAPQDKALLLPIQDVYRVDDQRLNVGRVEAGVIVHGQDIELLPSHQVTKVAAIKKYMQKDLDQAGAGECIGLTTLDPVFLDRGHMVCHPGREPMLTDSIDVNIFWMSTQDFTGKQLLRMRCATQETSCKIECIRKRINSSTLEIIAENADVLKNLEVAEAVIKTKKPIAITAFNDVQELGRFVLVHEDNVCAGGIIISGRKE